MDEFKLEPSESVYIYKQPKLSTWKCHLFGSKPDSCCGIAYTPAEGSVPNIFIRYMMKICFGCTWIKGDDDGK